MKTKTERKYSMLCFSVVLAASVILSAGTISKFVQAQSQVMPFEIGDDLSQKNTTGRNASSAERQQSSDNLPCSMPPCPPGQACIQSCP